MLPATRPDLAESLRRLWLIPFILAIEATAAVQIPHPWFNLYLYRGVPVYFGLTLLFFGRHQLSSLRAAGFHLRWAAVHAVTLALIVLAEAYLLAFGNRPYASAYLVVGYAWTLLLFSLVPSLLLTFLSRSTLARVARRLGWVWLYAVVSSGALVLVMEWLRRSWMTDKTGYGNLLEDSAFTGVQRLLEHFFPVVVSDPQTHLLGTDRFQVIVAGTCSGVQGLALMSVLLLAWCTYERKRLRIGRALAAGLLAMVAMWLLNMVRLATLIAIGNAGHPKVAISGFHSEAGWIALNVVALGLLLLLERVAWFRKPTITSAPPALSGAQIPSGRAVRNVPAIYLLPFLAITAASVLSHAVSGGFEWLYPLRFIAALAAFWLYRRTYLAMDLRFGLPAIGAGVAVAIMWIGTQHLQVAMSRIPSQDLGSQLAALTQGQRSMWILFRVLAAVVTVPFAEELAFRGFLARRIVSAGVEAVPYGRLSIPALLLSAICFGLMHGSFWAVGIVAGLIFGLLAMCLLPSISNRPNLLTGACQPNHKPL